MLGGSDSACSHKKIESFIARVRPMFSSVKILGFAAALGIHPGIAVGQLQYRGEISYAHSRKLLVRIRHLIAESALTEGWGSPAPAEL